MAAQADLFERVEQFQDALVSRSGANRIVMSPALRSMMQAAWIVAALALALSCSEGGAPDGQAATVERLLERAAEKPFDLSPDMAILIRELVEHGEPAVPHLLKELAVPGEDLEIFELPDAAQRRAQVASWTLRAMGAEAAAELGRQLSNEDWQRRRAAAFVLRWMGPRGETAIPALTVAARDADARVRFESLRALAYVCEDREAMVPPCIVALGDTTPRVRLQAAQMMAGLGDLARAGSSQLRLLLRDERPELRIQAAVALWRGDT